MQIQLSRTQAGPGRAVKEQQEQNTPNHVQRINLISVHTAICSPGVALGPPGVRDECEGLDEDGEEGEGRRQQRVLVEELDPSVGAGVP